MFGLKMCHGDVTAMADGKRRGYTVERDVSTSEVKNNLLIYKSTTSYMTGINPKK